jgi:hypothetical protein
LFLFNNSKSFQQEKLDFKTSFVHGTDWILESLNLSGTTPTYNLRISSPLNLNQLNLGMLNYDLALVDFDLSKLAILNLNFLGNLNLEISNINSNNKNNLKFKSKLKNLSGDFDKLKISIPMEGDIAFDLEFPSNLNLFESGFNLSKLNLDLKDVDTEILKLEAEVNLKKKDSGLNPIIKVKSDSINLDKLKSIYIFENKSKQTESSTSLNDAQKLDEPVKEQVARDLKINWPYSKTQIELDLKNLVFHNYNLEEFLVVGQIDKAELNLNKIQIKNEKLILNSNFEMKFNNLQDYKLTVDADKIDIEAFKIFHDKDRGVRGSIGNFKLEAIGASANSDVFKKTLKANLNFNSDDIYLPKELMDVPPFNIIFIPFTVVSSAFSVIPKEVLPNDLINAGVGISSAIRDLQTFKLSQGVFDIRIENEIVFLEEIKLGSSISGDLYFSGQLKFNEEIEINSGISLLGIRIPLPISGTLDSPNPDIILFVKGIFTEFGLSIVELPVTFFSRFTNLFYDKNNKALDKPNSQIK